MQRSRPRLRVRDPPRLRVRKPFMVVGGVGAIVMTIIFLMRATKPDTSYYDFVLILSLLAVFLGVAYAPWMASFTETVERRNPALAATGLAVWGLIIRLVIAISVFIVPHIVNTVTTLVDRGPTVQAIAAGEDPALDATQNATVKAVAADPTIVTRVQAAAAKYATQLQTAAKIDPATTAALTSADIRPLKREPRARHHRIYPKIRGMVWHAFASGGLPGWKKRRQDRRLSPEGWPSGLWLQS